MVWDERIEENVMKAQEYQAGEVHGMEKGLQEGLQEGIQKGIQKKQTEMILNLNTKDIPIETIAECAGLSVAEVKNIIESNRK